MKRRNILLLFVLGSTACVTDIRVRLRDGERADGRFADELQSDASLRDEDASDALSSDLFIADTTVIDSELDAPNASDVEDATQDLGSDVSMLPELTLPPIDLLASRPVRPRSLMQVTTRRPTFHWINPDRVTGALVEVCRDVRCDSVVMRIDTPEGTSARATEELPPGLYYWRLFARVADARSSLSSAVWSFVVPFGASAARADAPDTSMYPRSDFDRDGRSEAFSVQQDNSGGSTQFVVLRPNLMAAPTQVLVTGSAGLAPRGGARAIGDLDGDGGSELFLAGPPGVFWSGRSAAVPLTNLQALMAPPGATAFGIGFSQATSAGDLDNDGYGDFVVGVPSLRSAAVFFGNAMRDLSARVPLTVLAPMRPTGETGTTNFGQHVQGCDFDGDGRMDLAVLESVAPVGAPSFTRLHVYDGATGLFRQRIAPLTLAGIYSSAEVGELDGDGRCDLVLSEPAFDMNRGRIVWFSGPLTATSTPRELLAGTVRGERLGSSLALGDIDADGDFDVVFSSTSIAPMVGGTLDWYRMPDGPRVRVYASMPGEFAPAALGVGYAFAEPFPSGLLVSATRMGVEDPEGGFLPRPSVLLFRTSTATSPLGVLAGRFDCAARAACDSTSFASQAAYR